MKIIDSKTKKLSYGELMHTYYENNKKSLGFKDFQTWALATAAAIQKVGMDCDMVGNTFFMAVRGPEGKENSVITWALNVDTVPNCVDNTTQWFKAMISEGVNLIATTYTTPIGTRVMRLVAEKLGVGRDALIIKDSGRATVAILNLQGV